MTWCRDILPEDLVFSILLWLPVVSLLRCKSVCKSWHTLIERSDFIRQHLCHHTSVANQNLIGRHENGCYRVLSGQNYEVSVEIDFEHDYNWLPIHQILLAGSCDGIICLGHRQSGDVALWNPTTKQLRILPDSPTPLILNEPIDHHNEFHYAFGFDVKKNDYKVVRIIMNVEEVVEEVLDVKPNPCTVEVYNLTTDSWRVIYRDVVLPVNFPIKYIFFSPYSIPRNGICFWCVTNRQYRKNSLLLSFDLSEEVFGTLALPDVCGGENDIADGEVVYNLDYLDGKFACILGVRDNSRFYTWHDRYGEPNYQIWVLQDYDVKESWTKLYTIGPVENIQPAMFSKNRDSLLVEKQIGGFIKLFLYDLGTQHMQDLHVQDDCPMFLHYIESLVSVKGVNHAGDEVKLSV